MVPASFVTKLLTEPWLIDQAYLPALVQRLDLLTSAAQEKAALLLVPSNEPELGCLERFGSIGVISIRGPIMKFPDRIDLLLGACDIDAVRMAAEIALADPSIEEVILRIDSPG